MIFEDKTIQCQSCNDQFIFSSGEQEFFKAKNLMNEPKRCPNCRVLLRAKRNGKGNNSTSKVDCAQCGTTTIVPFQPNGTKPIYCVTCFKTSQITALAR